MIEIKSLNDLSSLHSTQLNVIDFYADVMVRAWLCFFRLLIPTQTRCGPCHAIAPRYKALSEQYKDTHFFKCNVDAAKDVAAKYRVSAMPTFVFIKGGQVVDTVKGANAAGIEAAIKKHASGSSSFSGKGQTLGSGGGKSSGSTASSSEFNSHLYIGLALLTAYAGLWYFNM
ncbi:hypothetical protein E3P99_02627 [Wallemia hederae]|uniref:Thioredoxin domain-containing protein n=1 Tax=Wallemia hederae TaxID=1540922 RepID=A0A4T0FJH5_9BASI|nr:hypothetical protein E3P99_02627 [Wallemia hederae]